MARGTARSRFARRCAVLVLAAAALAVAVPGPAAAQDRPPWRAAEIIRADLFGAQTELILGGRAAAAREARSAAAAYDGELRDSAARGRAGRRRARHPRAAGGAHGGRRRRRAGARRGARRGRAARCSPAPTRSPWRPPGAATPRPRARGCCCASSVPRRASPGRRRTARSRCERLASGRAGAAQARQAVAKDLLDAYQARLRELLADADAALERRFGARQAETAAQAAEYWTILDERYAEDRGAPAARAASAAFTRAARAAARGDADGYRAARAAIDRALNGFTAAPLTGQESARRAQQLLRFLALVPVEYDRGVSGTRVTLDFEIQEAVAFRTGAEAAFADLEEQLSKRDAGRTKAVAADLARLKAIVEQAAERPEPVATAEDVAAVTKRAEDNLAAAMPKAWQEPTDESDYDLIALTLDRMEAAVGAGQYRQAEQARLEAYAFFEFGPERRLKSFDPGLAVDVEGLVWFGGAGHAGARRADRRPRPAARGAPDAHQARRPAGRRGRDARRQREQGHRGDELGDHRLPRGARGGADPRRHHRVVRGRAVAHAAAGAASARRSACSSRS